MISFRHLVALPIVSIPILLASCGGGDGSNSNDQITPPPASGPSEYVLDVTVSGSGKVTSSPYGIDCGSSCSKPYSSGASVTLTPTADSGYSFTGWGGDCSGTAACTLMMSAVRNVTARFAAQAASTPANCARQPSLCGYPDETNTGWRHTGVTLKVVNQDPYYIDTPGAVIDGLDIHGCVVVRAPNVTIKRSRITCGAQPMVKNFEPTGDGGLKDVGAGLVIEDVEFDGMGVVDSAGVAFDSYTIRRADFHDVGAAVKLGNDVVIEDSYVHDIASNSTSHNAGFPSDGGSNIVLRHNTVLMNTDNGFPIALYNGEAPGIVVQNVTVDNNLLAGGNYIFYCGAPGDVTPQLRITRNRISKYFNLNGGYYGVSANCEDAAQWSGNFWDEDLSTVTP